MDGCQFDVLARSFAKETSRRRVTLGLAAGALAGLLTGVRRGQQSAAQETGIRLGGSCNATGDCSQMQPCGGYGSVICADNGLSDDGALNCCMNEGGQCGGDAHCCGGLFCVGGGGDGCGAGVCRYPSTTGLELGRGCATSSECSQDGGPTICASNGLDYDGPLNCCRQSSGACASNRVCCGALLCIGGVCGGGSSDSELLAPGAQCFNAGQCDQSGGPTDCASNGITIDGSRNCCRYTGGACADGPGCCGSLLCLGGVCQ